METVTHIELSFSNHAVLLGLPAVMIHGGFSQEGEISARMKNAGPWRGWAEYKASRGLETGV